MLLIVLQQWKQEQKKERIEMDYESVGLLVDLIAEGFGVAKELSDLAKRIQEGD